MVDDENQEGSALLVTSIIIKNVISDTGSNPVRDCIYLRGMHSMTNHMSTILWLFCAKRLENQEPCTLRVCANGYMIPRISFSYE